MRRSFGRPSLLCGDPLSLSPGELWVDVRALEDGSLPVEEIGGDLLGGIELRNCPGFDTWLLLARLDCAARGRQELRRRALSLLAAGETEAAMAAAGRAAGLDPLDEDAQELLLRVLVAAGRGGLASAHLASCEALFAREGLVPSPALRSAARDPGLAPRPRMRAGVVAASLLQAGTAALDAGAVDAGVETLRRAAAEAGRAADPAVQAEVLRALGGALVHAVRGSDGEGAVVLHRALLAARTADRPALVADILRELAFVDVQAGRHTSADRALLEATQHACGDPGLLAGILAIRGMNRLTAGGTPRRRNCSWSQPIRPARPGVPARKRGRRGYWPARCCSPGRCSRPGRPPYAKTKLLAARIMERYAVLDRADALPAGPRTIGYRLKEAHRGRDGTPEYDKDSNPNIGRHAARSLPDPRSAHPGGSGRRR